LSGKGNEFASTLVGTGNEHEIGSKKKKKGIGEKKI